MDHGTHGPYSHVHVEQHTEGGYFVSKKAFVVLGYSFIVLVGLLFFSIYFIQYGRSRLEDATLAQELLQQQKASLLKENLALQDKLENADYEIFEMRLEVNALASNDLSGIISDTPTARETFSRFAAAINQGDYKAAYSLTDSDYQAECSAAQFVDAMQASRTILPPMKFVGEFIRSDLKAAVLQYEIFQNGTTAQVKAVLFFENGRWVVPIFNTEDCDATSKDVGPLVQNAG